MKLRSLCVAVVAALLSPSVVAYEQFTHAIVTRAAVSRSALAIVEGQLLRNLDVASFSTLDAQGAYFDIGNPFAGALGVSTRVWQPYENDMLDLLGISRTSILPGDWIIRGAIREDDNPNEDPPTPQDVSPGLKRPLHHFFDPYNNLPLNGGGVGALDGDIHKNPDWAIGSSDSFVRLNTPEMGRRNHFSLFDARESMFRAVTLKWRDTDGSFKDLALANVDASTRELWRKAYWATTFRALGDALHLIQDMAQPQHTRNEAHSGMLCRGVHACLGGHASVYEKYVDARARRTTKFRALAPFNTDIAISPSPLNTGAYQVPSLPRYADFWSTSPGTGSVDGLGLADYSNRGFFTAKYNLGNATYPNPSNFSGDYAIEARTPTTWDGQPVFGAPVYVYKGSVPDKVLGNATPDVALTAYSMWDQFTRVQSGQPSYSLNRVNYDAMADLLIPRAVAYSAGLLDYFFRGKLEIAVPDAGFYAIEDHAKFAAGTPTDVTNGFRGFAKLKVKVRNATPDITPPNAAPAKQLMTGGTLFAVVKFNRNRCYDDLLANWPSDRPGAQGCRVVTQEIVVSDPQPASVAQATPARPDGDEYVFLFSNQEVPINAWNVILQVVYRGRLGSEDDAVVVATKDLSEPTFVSFLNVSDHVLIEGSFYKPAQVEADPVLFAKVRTQCQSIVAGRPEIWRPCYGYSDSFEFFTPGATATGLTSSPSAIPPRRFGRVALLADLAVRPRFAFQQDRVSCWLLLANPYELAPYRAQLDAQSGGPYTPLDVVRDVPSWDTVSCYADVGAVLTPPGTFNLHQLDALQPAEKVPMPLAIVGW